MSEPSALPAEVVAFLAARFGLAPHAVRSYRARPATRTAHVAKVCTYLAVRPYAAKGERRLEAFL